MSGSAGQGLAEEDHERIFRELIVREFFPAGLAAAEAPRAIILGGQPGAGKSGLLSRATEELRAEGDTLRINGDEFRRYHPDHARWQRERPLEMATLTAADAGRWTEKTIAEAIRRGVHVVIESTMRQPETFERTSGALRDAGYHVEARALAIPEAESWLGVHQRYEMTIAAGREGRFAQRSAHDAAYGGMVATLAAIEQNGWAERVTLHRRDLSAIYDNERTAGGWVHPPSAAVALVAERDRPRDAQAQERHVVAWDEVASLKAARGLSQREIQAELGAAPRLPGNPLPATVTPSIEGVLAASRIRELARDPLPGRVELEHLRAIHVYIFQDFPGHAGSVPDVRPGEVRPDTESWTKHRALSTARYVYDVPYASQDAAGAAERAFSAFPGIDALRRATPAQAARHLADLYEGLDAAHPFLEGNSRTLRAFSRDVAQAAGWRLDWDQVQGTARDRDRLYAARDIAAIDRHYPGLNEATAMATDDRRKYEAWITRETLRDLHGDASVEGIIRAALIRAPDAGISGPSGGFGRLAAAIASRPADPPPSTAKGGPVGRLPEPDARTAPEPRNDESPAPSARSSSAPSPGR